MILNSSEHYAPVARFYKRASGFGAKLYGQKCMCGVSPSAPHSWAVALSSAGLNSCRLYRW